MWLYAGPTVANKGFQTEYVLRMRMLTPCMCVLHLPSSCGLLRAGPSVADHEAFWAEWALRIKTLERGIEQAREQGISVSKAKRVLKELQAQANAAEAASKLEALLLRKPCKASTLTVSSCHGSWFVHKRACLPLDKFRYYKDCWEHIKGVCAICTSTPLRLGLLSLCSTTLLHTKYVCHCVQWWKALAGVTSELILLSRVLF